MSLRLGAVRRAPGSTTNGLLIRRLGFDGPERPCPEPFVVVGEGGRSDGERGTTPPQPRPRAATPPQPRTRPEAPPQPRPEAPPQPRPEAPPQPRPRAATPPQPRTRPRAATPLSTPPPECPPERAPRGPGSGDWTARPAAPLLLIIAGDTGLLRRNRYLLLIRRSSVRNRARASGAPNGAPLRFAPSTRVSRWRGTVVGAPAVGLRPILGGRFASRDPPRVSAAIPPDTSSGSMSSGRPSSGYGPVGKSDFAPAPRVPGRNPSTGSRSGGSSGAGRSSRPGSRRRCRPKARPRI